MSCIKKMCDVIRKCTKPTRCTYMVISFLSELQAFEIRMVFRKEMKRSSDKLNACFVCLVEFNSHGFEENSKGLSVSLKMLKMRVCTKKLWPNIFFTKN